MKKRNLILITRPLDKAKRFSETATRAGLKTMIEPMLGIRKAVFKNPDMNKYDSLVFTSTNGVKFFPAAMGGVTVFCVGEATASEANAKGFRKIMCVTRGVEELALLIKGHKPVQALYVRGEHISFPLGEHLRATGVHIDELVVYKADLKENFSEAALRAFQEGRIAAVTFFSKRTAKNFVRLAQKNNLLEELKAIKCLSISPAVLECVQSAGWQKAYAAPTPDAPGMLKIITDTCNDPAG